MRQNLKEKEKDKRFKIMNKIHGETIKEIRHSVNVDTS